MATVLEAASPVATVSSGRRSRGLRRRIVVPVVSIAAMVGLWELIIIAFSVKKYIIPSPLSVVEEFSNSSTVLLHNLWPTVIESVEGFILGNMVAIALAILFVHVRSAERALMPAAMFVRTVPIIAIAPVLVIIFGTGYTPKVIIAAVTSFFPTLINMVKGLESVDRQALELMRVLSASRREVFVKVRLYASLPYLFASLKIATSSSIIGALVAEWVGADKGLGYLIIQSTYNLEVPLLYATMILTAIYATIFYALIGIAERLLVTWQPADQS